MKRLIWFESRERRDWERYPWWRVEKDRRGSLIPD